MNPVRYKHSQISFIDMSKVVAEVKARHKEVEASMSHLAITSFFTPENLAYDLLSALIKKFGVELSEYRLHPDYKLTILQKDNTVLEFNLSHGIAGPVLTLLTADLVKLTGKRVHLSSSSDCQKYVNILTTTHSYELLTNIK